MSVQHVILDTIEDKVKKMSLQACVCSDDMKKVLSLSILTDLMEWAENSSVEDIAFIQSKIDLLLQNNLSCFDTSRLDKIKGYRNVNLPQNKYTWQQSASSDSMVVSDGTVYVKINNLIEI